MAVQGTQPITKERWQRIKEVFEAVLETPREQRSSAVAELCHGDTSLCAEVESLLEGLDKADAFMNRPAIAGVAAEFGARQQVFQVGDLVSSRFKIVRFIGQGGMGEVYEAQDLEIDSHIALKTIRPEIAAHPDILARFKQEAQVTRLVTHPNVCRTFDVSRHRVPATDAGADRDVIYLTMELLEGETLAQRLRRGRMTIAEALPLIRQMAAALDSAHSAGVIHRDFKPGNVILCERSSAGAISQHIRAVVTDFGLARNFSLAESLSLSITTSGAVIGTLSYMAPEQLEGDELTPAADIYSFGLVVYEMLTGVQPFHRESALGSVLARLKKPPVSPRTHIPELSPSWESAILRCLAIEPKMRFERASQVCEGLEVGQAAQTAPHKQAPLTRHWLLFAFGFMLLAALGIWMSRPLVRFSRQARVLPKLLQFTTDGGITKQPTVSADGQIVAFVSDRGGDGILNIWSQPTRGGAATQVTHESFNATEPALSPDGKEIAFHSDSDDGIYIVPTAGGPKKLVAAKGRGPRFSPDGKQILYWSGDDLGSLGDRSFYPNARVYVAPADGGTARRIGEQFADARLPAWSSDGKHILFFGIPYGLNTGGGQSAFDLGDWWVLDPNKPDPPIKTGGLPMIRRHLIDFLEIAPQWWRDSLIFSARTGQSENLFRVRISPANFQITDEPEQLTFGTTYNEGPAISSTGQLFVGSLIAAVNIWGLPLASPRPGPFSASALIPLVHAASVDTRPSISLNGQRLVFARRAEEKRLVWLKDLLTGKETQLTQAEGTSPIISRDGTSVAFSSRSSSGPTSIKVMDLQADGTTKGVKELCNDCGDPMDWASDGSGILYSYAESTAIGLVDVKSGRTTALLHHTGAIGSATFCPRNECIVFVEMLDGVHSRIWLAPMRDLTLAPEAQWTQITDGRFVDDKPRWSPDGKWLYFYSTRDGFRCFWKLRFIPGSHQPQGVPEPVMHLHTAGLTLFALSRAAFDLRVSNDKLVFAAVSQSGNIWRTDLGSW